MTSSDNGAIKVEYGSRWKDGGLMFDQRIIWISLNFNTESVPRMDWLFMRATESLLLERARFSRDIICSYLFEISSYIRLSSDTKLSVRTEVSLQSTQVRTPSLAALKFAQCNWSWQTKNNVDKLTIFYVVSYCFHLFPVSSESIKVYKSI